MNAEFETFFDNGIEWECIREGNCVFGRRLLPRPWMVCNGVEIKYVDDEWFDITPMKVVHDDIINFSPYFDDEFNDSIDIDMLDVNHDSHIIVSRGRERGCSINDGGVVDSRRGSNDTMFSLFSTIRDPSGPELTEQIDQNLLINDALSSEELSEMSKIDWSVEENRIRGNNEISNDGTNGRFTLSCTGIMTDHIRCYDKEDMEGNGELNDNKEEDVKEVEEVKEVIEVIDVETAEPVERVRVITTTQRKTNYIPLVKIKRNIIIYTQEDVQRAARYLAQYHSIHPPPENEMTRIVIKNVEYAVVPTKVWQFNYFMYQMPNDINDTLKLLEKFRPPDDQWKYYCNYVDQPHYEIAGQRLPFRHIGQSGNFYEPFIIRECHKRDEGIIKNEVALREKRYRMGKNKNDTNYHVEAMCPYCPITFNRANDINDYFYGRNDSEYLHHITKHHGVFSDGSEHPLPEFVVYDKKERYFAYCGDCGNLVKIKKISVETKADGNRFLGFLRHSLSHSTNSKNGKGESRLDRREMIIKKLTEEEVIYEE